MGLFTRRNQDTTAAVATLEVDPALAALTGDYVIDMPATAASASPSATRW